MGLVYVGSLTPETDKQYPVVLTSPWNYAFSSAVKSGVLLCSLKVAPDLMAEISFYYPKY